MEEGRSEEDKATSRLQAVRAHVVLEHVPPGLCSHVDEAQALRIGVALRLAVRRARAADEVGATSWRGAARSLDILLDELSVKDKVSAPVRSVGDDGAPTIRR